MAVENYRQITEVFADGIVAPLTDGLSAILSVADIINKINSSSIQAPDCEKILDLIATANCKTEQATKAAHRKLEELNDDILQLIVSKKALQDQIKSKEEVLQQKERQTDRLETENKVLTHDLKEAKSQLEEAVAKQAQAQADYDRADGAASVSLALMAIPILGTIAGGIAYAVYQAECNQAENRRNEWENFTASHEANISDYKEKLSTLKGQRENIFKEISKMKQDLICLDEKQREKKSLFENGTLIQSEMKQLTTFLSQLNGKADVMEIICTGIVNLEQICYSISDIIDHLETGVKRYDGRAISWKTATGQDWSLKPITFICDIPERLKTHRLRLQDH